MIEYLRGTIMSNNECNEKSCEGCSKENCPSHQKIEKLKTNPGTKIKHTIAVISGKGGVGKSLVTSLLAKELHELGHSVAIMDADITGPSIPKAFGVVDKAMGDETGIYAIKSKGGIPLMSVNCLLEDESDPIVWRGPLIANLVTQLYSNVIYGEVEYLLIDMPPGTGDVPLTVFQQIPVDGAIVISTPQDLVSLIVEKSVKMGKQMNVPLLGVVTNMAYVNCPHCNEKIYLYGKPKTEEIAKEFGLRNLDEVAIDPLLASKVDAGDIESYAKRLLPKATSLLENLDK